jgi:hypothetical protein
MTSMMKSILDQFTEAGLWFRDLAQRFSVRRDTAPIATVARVEAFAATRSALITQKKLYGYLKERMGISYPKMFEDEVFANAIHIATMHIFAASLSDLTVHVVGNATAGSTLPAPERCRMAVESYKAGIEANAAMVTEPDAPDKWLADFEARIDDILWDNVAAGGNAFTESPKALIKWAPISDEYKKYDREIVENSIRYAWNEIREDFRKRLDAPAVVADWTAADAA